MYIPSLASIWVADPDLGAWALSERQGIEQCVRILRMSASIHSGDWANRQLIGWSNVVLSLLSLASTHSTSATLLEPLLANSAPLIMPYLSTEAPPLLRTAAASIVAKGPLFMKVCSIFTSPYGSSVNI